MRVSVPSVCGQTARRAMVTVGDCSIGPVLSARPRKAVLCRLAGAGVIEICRLVNNPPLRRNNASVKSTGAVTPRESKSIFGSLYLKMSGICSVNQINRNNLDKIID